MLTKCRECGAEISSLAKSCPKCGCPNKATGKSKLAVASLVLGIFDALYAFAICLTAYFGDKNFEFVFVVIVTTIMSIVFGITSLSKVKKKSKSVAGIALGVASAIVTAIACIV